MIFRPIYRRALNECQEQLSKEDYVVLLDTYKRPRRHDSTGKKIDLMLEVEKLAYKSTKGSILKWLKENWFLVLKLIFSLLPLFLMVDENQPT
jgi:hypothetical protein